MTFDSNHALFAPAQLAGLALKNRWVMAPLTRCRSPGGGPTQQAAEYYAKRAAGGVGMIISEGTLVDHPLAGAYPDVPYLREDTVPGWKRITDAVHAEGSRMLAQVWHTGPVARPGIGKVAVHEAGAEVVRAMDRSDEETLRGIYGAAVDAAVRAGFDGVELHAAHGYLLDSYLRAGDTGFVVEVIQETRRVLGPDRPIVLRFSTWTVDDYAANYFTSPRQLESLLAPLVDAGVDVFHPSVRRFWVSPFPDDEIGLAGWTRRVTGQPTIVVGNIGLATVELTSPGPASLDALIDRYDAGQFDLACIGRPLITDPAWVNKVRAGEFDRIKEFYPEAPKEIYP